MMSADGDTHWTSLYGCTSLLSGLHREEWWWVIAENCLKVNPRNRWELPQLLTHFRSIDIFINDRSPLLTTLVKQTVGQQQDEIKEEMQKLYEQHAQLKFEQEQFNN